MKNNATPAALDATGSRYLTRAEVARRLAIGVSSVRRLEGRALHPQVGADGVHRFAAAEVEAHRASSLPAGTDQRKPRAKGTARPEGTDADGKRHARAFRLFEEGKSHAEVVIEAALPSAVVRQLHQEWRAGYRQPPPELPLPAEDPQDGDAAAWTDWEKKMQTLSSDLDVGGRTSGRDVDQGRSRLGWRSPRWRGR